MLSLSSPDAYFEFHPDRLSDVDEDGWPEYTDGYGNYFILVDGNVLFLESSTQSEYTVDDLQDTH